MSIESRLSGHWTDDELIQHLYGVGPSDGHIEACRECQGRLSAAETQRRALEADLSESGHEGAGYDFLMAQRRHIYAKISQPANRWTDISVGRWAPAAAALLVLAGGVVLYDQRFRQDTGNRHVSDAQLARDVSCMAADSEPRSTEPLRALFVE
jgi:hypothetical protein